MHKVLIVNDEESVRYSFKKLLREPAYQVLEAKEGNEALDKVKADSPDLVILDIQMPGLSGLEVLQQIKSAATKTPVLIITAYGSSDRVIAAMKHGALQNERMVIEVQCDCRDYILHIYEDSLHEKAKRVQQPIPKMLLLGVAGVLGEPRVAGCRTGQRLCISRCPSV